ncbi:MAG TPA: SulP family inorganic anion transporter [Tessaracoccus flavescens]|uniref:SulP family inorganic anion transporter n=1 Tax=Tessaracoccus flavescens TaxID=399497 RepID=A0A921JRF7_9ACTN|nr:SulP family inorganic anion transporter [Tessaracoccus flavescens]
MADDSRREAPHHTPAESWRSAQVAAAHRMVGLRELIPRPRDYRGLGKTWPKDLIAGLTVGVVALPLALGFGVASGAGAAAGMVTAVIAGIVAAVFGGSHLQVSGPTGAMTVVLLPVIAQHGIAAVPLLAIMAGAIVVLSAVAGLGRAVDLIPVPVVEGFTMGIGVIIAIQQVPLLLGAPAVKHESTVVSSWRTALAADWSRAWAPLLIAGLVLVIATVLTRYAKRWPAALIAIVVATLVVEATGLDVDRIGALPSGLPGPALPDMSWGLLQQLAPAALAIAALAALESLLSARVADGMAPHIPRTKPNRELFGQGLANIASGFFGGLPATGAIARTAVNVRSGGRTRLAAISHAVFLLIVMMLLAPVVSRIPLAALAGVLVATASRMINIGLAGSLLRSTRADRNTFLLTVICTVALDLIAAVLLGVLMAGVMSIRHMASYTVVRRQSLPADTQHGLVDIPEDAEWLRPRLGLVRVDGALFYANARRFIREVTAKKTDAVIIRCHRLQVMDASGTFALKEAVEELERRGQVVIVQGMTDSQLRTATVLGAIRPEQHVPQLRDAIDAARQALTPLA